MSNDKPGNGNGVTSANQQEDAMCPIDPTRRPQDCRTFEQRLTALEKQTSALRGEVKTLGGDVRAGNVLLSSIWEELVVIAAKQGRKIKKPEPAKVSVRKK